MRPYHSAPGGLELTIPLSHASRAALRRVRSAPSGGLPPHQSDDVVRQRETVEVGEDVSHLVAPASPTLDSEAEQIRPLSGASQSTLRHIESAPAEGLPGHQSDVVVRQREIVEVGEDVSHPAAPTSPTLDSEAEQIRPLSRASRTTLRHIEHAPVGVLPRHHSDVVVRQQEIVEVGEDVSHPAAPTSSPLDLEADQIGSPRNEKYVRNNILFCKVIALIGGILIGYLLNITGGLLGMNPFLIRISHETFTKKLRAKQSNYCIYLSQWMLLFTSSIHISAIVGLCVAPRLGSIWGPRVILLCGSLLSLVGICLASWFPHVSVVVLGMILIGLGVGLIHKIIPTIYGQLDDEEARNKIDLIFDISTSWGATLALLVNYIASQYHPWGWRMSFGMGGIPCLYLLLAAYAVDRVKEDHLKDSLSFILRPRSRPMLGITTVAVVLRQLSGLSVVVVFGPFLLQSIGFHEHESFLAPMVVSGVGSISAIAVTFFLRYTGRRKMLILACIATFSSQLCIWAVFYTKLEPLHHVKKSVAYIVLSVVPIYSFGASALTLPHGWLGDSYPAECRALGFVWRISLSMFMNIFMVQTSLHFLCSLHEWLFFSLAVVSLLTASFVYFFVPETTDVDEDAMVDEVWRRHWFWRQYMADERRNDS